MKFLIPIEVEIPAGCDAVLHDGKRLVLTPMPRDDLAVIAQLEARATKEFELNKRLRVALHKLCNGYKYSAEVCGIAREALGGADEPTARPDQDALDAVPALKDAKAVVLYFPTEADRDEFVAIVQEAKPGMRAVNL